MKSADGWFNEGLAALDLSRSADHQSELVGDLERALESFDQALVLEPAHLGALRQRGLVLAQLDQHEAALDAFVAAASIAPADPDLRLAVGRSLVEVGRRDAALDAFDEVLRLRPGDEEALFGRASELMALRRYEPALAAWDEVLRAPDDKTLTRAFRRVQAQLSRADALGRLGRPEALPAFREVFDAEASHLSGPLAPGVFHEALRTLEVARCAWRAHLEAHAKEPSTWRRAGQTWLAVGRSDEALRAWDRLVSLAPDAQAWFGKAEAHAQAGQLDAAIAAYQRSLELWPGFLGASARLQVALEQRGKQSASGPWKVMGRDTFAREDFVVGEFATKEAAEARIAQLDEATARTQDEALRDSYWLVPPPSGRAKDRVDSGAH